MKVYISGKITGLEGYKEMFGEAEAMLLGEGYVVMNPSVLPFGFDYDDYMHISYAMIDVCDAVYFLRNWKDSKGAILEYRYAVKKGKKIIFQ